MTEEYSAHENFGARLRAEREERQISLEEISRVTKISIHLLHAMENDDWDSLPGGIFTRNFIRLYTNYLGLAAEEWVDHFRQYLKSIKRSEGDEADQDEELKPKLNLPQGWLYALFVFTVALLGGGYLLITSLQSDFQQEAAAETDVVNEPEGEAAPADEENETVIMPEDNTPAPLTVELEDTTGTRPWYMITADGYLQTLEGGERLEIGKKVKYTATDSIRLFIVRREGVKIFINDAEVDWETLETRERVDENGNRSYVVNITANSPS